MRRERPPIFSGIPLSVFFAALLVIEMQLIRLLACKNGLKTEDVWKKMTCLH